MKRCNSKTACCLLSAIAIALGSIGTGVAATKGSTKQAALPPVAASGSMADALSPSIDATPVINTSRMVTYTWSASRSYAVRALGGLNTDIEVPAGETIRGFYLSNANDWSFHVTGDNKRVLLKPAQSGLYNTALLVTDQRTYQLTLVSVPPSDIWFQRVSWNVPTATQGLNGVYWEPGHQAGASTGANVPDVASINPASLYFEYAIRGDAAFKPIAVFDDGERTWIKFPAKAQDLPAIFAITDHKLDVVNYSVADGYVVVPRVAAEFDLRLDGKQVTVRRGCDPTRCLK